MAYPLEFPVVDRLVRRRLQERVLALLHLAVPPDPGRVTFRPVSFHPRCVPSVGLRTHPPYSSSPRPRLFPTIAVARSPPEAGVENMPWRASPRRTTAEPPAWPGNSARGVRGLGQGVVRHPVRDAPAIAFAAAAAPGCALARTASRYATFASG